MRKKTHKTKPKTARKDQTLRITIISFLGLVLMLGAAAFFNLQPAGDMHCANTLSCAKDLSGKPTADNEGIYFGQKVQAPDLPNTESFAIANARQAVLGDSTATKHIYVDLTNQRLYAYEGTTLIMNTLISSGLYNHTPTGDFHIWVWLRATHMTGGSGADYYDLPNVPYTMYFYNDQVQKSWGYSLHGTYWHHNFGHPMSHGCVNMQTPDAERIFNWTDPNPSAYVTHANSDADSPLITIYGTTPVN
jgi:hypothetical protein